MAIDTANQITDPRWTHIALPCADLDQSLEWYQSYTPLTPVHRHERPGIGMTAWLSNPGQVTTPFVLVLSMKLAERGQPKPLLQPFAHLGIELPARSMIDEIAVRARAAGCLAWEPQDLPAPVGYVCALRDPDGNLVEMSHGQEVFSTIRALWKRDGVADVVLGYIDALNSHDADAIAACVTEDFFNEHTTARGQSLRGRANYRERLDSFLASFPVMHYEVEDLVVDDARAVVAYRMVADFAGADGAQAVKPIDVRGVFRFEVRDGHIAHRVDYRDGITVEQQLGLRG